MGAAKDRLPLVHYLFFPGLLYGAFAVRPLDGLDNRFNFVSGVRIFSRSASRAALNASDRHTEKLALQRAFLGLLLCFALENGSGDCFTSTSVCRRRSVVPISGSLALGGCQVIRADNLGLRASLRIEEVDLRSQVDIELGRLVVAFLGRQRVDSVLLVG